MTRARLPGSFCNGGQRIDTSRHCCDGRCMGGDCPLIVRRVPAPTCPPREPVYQRPVIGAQLHPGQVIPIRIAVTGGRISRARRVRRFLRALWSFLIGPRWL